MAKSAEELKHILETFTRNCEENLKLGPELCTALDSGEMDDIAPAPFHLNILMEKYVELLETRLIPALGAKPPDVAHTPRMPKNAGEPTPAPAKDYHTPKSVTKSFAREVIGGPSAQTQEPKPAPEAAAPEPLPEPEATPTGSVVLDDEHTGGARRVIPRYNQRLAVRYMVTGRDKRPVKAFSRDIGAMGLFIVANRLEKSGQGLSIEVELPDHGKITMQGSVVWTKWVPPALRTVDYPGFAVKIHSAPEAWFSYFMAVEGQQNEAS